MSQCEILSVVDNYRNHPRHSAKGLLGEHGISFLITKGEKRILFDTGGGLSIQQNAIALGLDLASVDTIVLSHAHNDHTGGLETVLSNTGEVEVYVHPDIFKPKYMIKEGKEAQYSGLLKTKKEYELLGAKFVLKEKKQVELGEGIYLVGPIGRVKPSDDLNMPYRHIKVDNSFYPDPFTDEQVLVIDTPKGLLIVLGCTHNGLENTINEIKEVMGHKKIFGIIGGLHLCDTSLEKVKELALWLKELQIKLLACGHCTGFEAIVSLYQLLENNISFNFVGKRIIL